jgi:pyridoxine/pyridoxamine 5'-phosphate oxidase
VLPLEDAAQRRAGARRRPRRKTLRAGIGRVLRDARARSQLGAWASLQSQPLPDRAEFDARYAEAERRFADGDVSRPPHWGGYLVVPDRIEFWYGADFRLHERVLYRLDANGWSRQWLYP